ncbi:cAMP-dependent protein kinase type II regulatory subunit [Hondaea fermentalgiana]|uniref:cAMP-dependent protein kinase type II regulatory subunit n=1 Tax=Hondaea fermentalgiana TaxID=2315210 RepID=A0A2R5GBK9_9STRA|nr:cAMP-dependent protein kinase type II regulatory subunit [Hondaea fermentalgiana]|eukprot:GBG28376.1 cAMP-dependent protein kinase type II regulatory subunit [Hondaea fermentalgiana]
MASSSTLPKGLLQKTSSSATLQQDWERRRKHLIFANSGGELEDDDENAEATAQTYASAPNARERLVLVFDEDEYESKHTVEALESLQFSVVSVSEPEQALRVFQERRANFDVLVLGLRGPGYETLRFLEAVGPVKMPVLLTLSAESCDLSELCPEESPDMEVGSPMSSVDNPYSSLRSLKMSMSFMNKRENTSELVARAIELGASAYMVKPVKSEPLDRRLRDLMKRFHSAAQEFKRMVDFNDPDYITKQTRQLMLESHKHETRKSVGGFVVNGMPIKAPRAVSSVDTQGIDGLSKAGSKFGLALKRTKAAHQARVRVERANAKMVMSVIAGMAQKKTRLEGALPLLVNFRGQVSHIQLPWEKKRLENIEKEYGSVPHVRARDILQSDFREHVPRSKSATSGQRFLQKGYELKLKGDLPGAIRLYTRATLAEKRYSAAHLCRGVAYHMLGDDESAMQDFTQCLRIDPKSTSARFNRALIFSNEHRDHAAIRELDEAIALDKTDEGLIAFRAFIRRRCGDFARAQDDYKAAADLAAVQLRRRSGSGSEDSDSNSSDSDEPESPKNPEEDALRATASMSEAAQRDGLKQKKKWDTNYDGRVDLAEFTSATQRCDSVYAEIFQKRSDIEIACSKAPGLRTADDLKMIFHACREITLFRKMPQRYIRELAREIRLASVLPGDYVIQQGASAYNFFAILEGEVHVTVDLSEVESEHVIHRMYHGECFGENALINGSKREVNIVVPSDGESALIFIISKALFQQTQLEETIAADRNRTSSILRNCQIFDTMEEAAFEDLCKISRTVELEHNSVVLRQGEATSRFCVLVSGICRTLRYSDAGADTRKRIRNLEHACEQFEMSFAVHHQNKQDARTMMRVARVKEQHEERLREIESLKVRLAALESGEVKLPRTKLIDTGTIYPGNVFGEAALLDPYYGREEYTVVADTYVTLICIHKEQLQVCKHVEALLEGLRLKKNVGNDAS